MSSLTHKLKHEVRAMIPIILFFFVGFQLLALTQALMLREYGVKVSSFLAATVAALVVAKVVAIADLFKFVNRFPNRPLIYNIVWKTFVYFVGSFAFRYVEHLVHFWRESSGFVDANRKLFDEVVWAHFWVVQLWLCVLLLIHCTIRELTRTLGRERVIAMFFGESPMQAYEHQSHERAKHE